LPQEESTSDLENICLLLLLQGTDETLSQTDWGRTCPPHLWYLGAAQSLLLPL